MEVIPISNSNWFHELFIQEAKAAKTTRENMGGSDPVVEALAVTENGTYLPPEGVDGFNPVQVDVPETLIVNQDKTITENGTYTADDGYTGLGTVSVNVASSGGSEMEEQFIRLVEGDASNPCTELPAGITKIGKRAFREHAELKLASLPAGVAMIDEYAFYKCTGLELTSLPDGLTTIGQSAFSGCTNLKLTSLPDGLTTIGQSAFNGCSNLNLTSLPAGLTTICLGTFLGCTSLKLMYLHAGIETINAYAFQNCIDLTEITFEGTPNSIANNVFMSCTNLLTINVPWAEGEVANAPWGATNATINYNYVATEYPFENGSRTFSAFYDSSASCDSTLTVSGGNHINLVTTSGTGNCNCNVSDISQNDETKINNTAVSTTKKPTKFSLKAGDVVRTVVTPSESHTESSWSLFFVTANGTATKDIASNSKMDNTITMDADLDVGCIGMWCQIAPADVIDMDVAIYVNDVRYV